MKTLLTLVLSSTVALISSVSQAGLIGNPATIERNYYEWSRVYQVDEVGPGFETYNFQNWAFDLGDYSIDMHSGSNTGYAAEQGFLFTLDFGDTGEIISNVIASGFDSKKMSFTDNTISLDFSWSGFYTGQHLNFQIETTQANVTAPGSLGIMGLGLAGLVVLRRRGTK